jgi:SAM-dependent methyltransferase
MRITSFKEFINAIIQRLYLFFLRSRIFLQIRLGFVKIYQPNPFYHSKRIDRFKVRNCEGRFEAFSNSIPKGTPMSVLDIGCEQGYFVFRMAERGGFCIGIDWDRHKIEIAKAIATIHEVNNAVFVRMEIDDNTVRTLPKVDMVVCLSIFHHWARKLGEKKARMIMKYLAGCASRYFVFETGQPNEIDTMWADKLSFMKPDADTWSKSLLHELGFRKVKKLGQFSTTVSNVTRNLYIAQR